MRAGDFFGGLGILAGGSILGAVAEYLLDSKERKSRLAMQASATKYMDSANSILEPERKKARILELKEELRRIEEQ